MSQESYHGWPRFDPPWYASAMHPASLLLLCLAGGLTILAPTSATAAPVARKLEFAASGPTVEAPLGEKVRHRLEGSRSGAPLVKLEQTDEHVLVVTPGEREGNARIVLATDRQFAVWSVRVDAEQIEASSEQVEAAKKACSSYKRTLLRLEATVKSAACLEALAPLTALLENSEVRLRWNEVGLRAQLGRYEEALAGLPDASSLKLLFIGAELRPEGVLTDSASLDAVRLALFDASIGPLRLDLSRIKLAR